jgi:hypothetical protein
MVQEVCRTAHAVPVEYIRILLSTYGLSSGISRREMLSIPAAFPSGLPLLPGLALPSGLLLPSATAMSLPLGLSFPPGLPVTPAPVIQLPLPLPSLSLSPVDHAA